MDDRIDRWEVSYVGVTDPVDPDRGRQLFEHVDEYDIPDRFDDRTSTVRDGTVDDLGAAGYGFADHTEWAPGEYVVDPTVFFVEYRTERERIAVAFVADHDSVTDCLDAVDHVMSETALTTLEFDIDVDVGVDLSGDDETPRAFVESLGMPNRDPTQDGFLHQVKVLPDEDRTEIHLSYSTHGPDSVTEIATLTDAYRSGSDYVDTVLR